MPEFILVAGCVLVLIYTMGIIRYSRTSSVIEPTTAAPLDLREVTVVIPFHNEENNLEKLISQLPIAVFGDIILCNDHSTDASLEIAGSIVSLYENMHLINAEKPGKKHAIRAGVLSARSKYILTLDCDIHLEWTLWKKLDGMLLSTNKELWISPVRMKEGKGFRDRLQNFEWLALETVKRSTWLHRAPLLANGAFLLFSRDSFKALDGKRHDYNLASGDDIFLLHAIIKEYGVSSIGWIDLAESSPAVEPANSWGEYLSQRARWAGKNPRVKSISYKATSLLFLSGHFGFFLLLVAMILNPQWAFIPVFLLFIKTLSEIGLVNSSARYFSRSMRWPSFIPVSVVYPFIVLTIGLKAILSSNSRNWSRNFP